MNLNAAGTTIESLDMCANKYTITTFIVPNKVGCDRPPLPNGMPRTAQVDEILDSFHDGPWITIEFQFVLGKLVNWTVNWNEQRRVHAPNEIAYWRYWRPQLIEKHRYKYVVVKSVEDDGIILWHTSHEAIEALEKYPGAYYAHIGGECHCIVSTFDE